MQRILIVDDDRETCVFIAELLEQPDRQFELAHTTRSTLWSSRVPSRSLW